MNKIKKNLIPAFYIVNFVLIIIYLFPGSLLGCFVYKDCSMQLQITRDFIVSSNHFYSFGILSTLSILLYKNTKKIKFVILYLFLLSIILELFHIIIPNREFEVNDLLGNITGIIFVIIFFKVKDMIYEDLKVLFNK